MGNYIIQLISIGVGGLLVGIAVDEFKREKYIGFGFYLLLGLDIWLGGLVARMGLAFI